MTERALLTARPQPGEKPSDIPRGLQPLGLEGARDGLVYVPPRYRADRPAPLLLMLHGAGADAETILPPFVTLADDAGLILLAPDSRERSWDVIVDGFGPDVAFIDRALARIFALYAIDPTRLATGGFSDGASYALSLGLSNGELFTHIVAFSPGFMAPARQQGAPRIFMSHGVRDPVLPIESCSRRIAPLLRHAGYRVDYREFDGGHIIPPEIAREAFEWLLRRG